MSNGYDDMVIKTNNVPRDVIDDWDQQGEQNDSYVIYKGEKYPLEDFQSVTALPEFHPFMTGKWSGFISDSYFSGILLKWVPGTNMEQVIMGRFYT